jgi:sulfide:quinone oxidoreductase
MEKSGRAHVLIAGGGVAALESSLALRALAGDRVAVELLAPEPHFWYRPLAVAEPFGLGEMRRFELSTLAADAGATFTHGTLVSVDVARRLAYTDPGGALPYSTLLIACGTRPRPAVDGAITFRGPADTEAIEGLLTEIERGEVRQIAFVVSAGAVWSLPAYELALMTAAWVETRGITGVELTLVTPESEPLHLFGREGSNAVQALLDAKGIAVHTGAYAAEAREGELLFVGDQLIPADRVVALPRLQGTRIGGIPQTFEGFVDVDEYGQVAGLADVYAAGDITTFPVKQGGIAAQQAEAAAEAIAAAAGVDLKPRPFRPVLRGLLLTGEGPRYLRGGGVGVGAGEASQASSEPLWWPPAKIVGRYLSPFLAQHAGTAAPPEPSPGSGVRVEVHLEPGAEHRRDRLFQAALADSHAESSSGTVGDVMADEPLVVAPDNTIGEVAERMRALDLGTALVAEYGRLSGIMTSRDMLAALAGRVHSSEARVRQWMTADPITVSKDTALHTAELLMTEHRINHLPVVDGERPVGLVGMRDVVRARSHLRMGIGPSF